MNISEMLESLQAGNVHLWDALLEEMHRRRGSGEAIRLLKSHLEKHPPLRQQMIRSGLVESRGSTTTRSLVTAVFASFLDEGRDWPEVRTVAVHWLRLGRPRREVALRYLLRIRDLESLLPILDVRDAGVVEEVLSSPPSGGSLAGRVGLRVWLGLHQPLPDTEPEWPRHPLTICSDLGLFLRDLAVQEYQSRHFPSSVGLGYLRKELYRVRNACALQLCIHHLAELGPFVRLSAGGWARRVKLTGGGEVLIPWEENRVPSWADGSEVLGAAILDPEVRRRLEESDTLWSEPLFQWRHWSSWQPECRGGEWGTSHKSTRKGSRSAKQEEENEGQEASPESVQGGPDPATAGG